MAHCYESLAARNTQTGMHFDDMYSLELVCQGLMEIHLDGVWHPVPALHVVWPAPRSSCSSSLGELKPFLCFFIEMVEQCGETLSRSSIAGSMP